MAIEVKASERRDKRLTPKEVIDDIEKLAAHVKEAKAKGGGFLPVMLVVDTAPDEKERMMPQSLEKARNEARSMAVEFLYLSPTTQTSSLN